jgi:hypothetical protein
MSLGFTGVTGGFTGIGSKVSGTMGIMGGKTGWGFTTGGATGAIGVGDGLLK